MPRTATSLNETSTGADAAQRVRRRRPAAQQPPLGSLTQQDGPDAVCRVCDSPQVTRLAMTLTDGTPVDFTSCHRCEHRRWEHAGSEIGVKAVLERTRKSI